MDRASWLVTRGPDRSFPAKARVDKTDERMTNVLVAGQAVQDLTYKVDEIPTEAKKYRSSKLSMGGGGCAANAAVTIARLGGSPWLAARVGDDLFGDLIRSELEQEEVDISNLQRIAGACSEVSTICVDPDGERQIVNALGKFPRQPQMAWKLPEIDAVLADTRWLGGCKTALEIAEKRGIPSVVDAEAPVPTSIVKRATHVAFSLTGLIDFTGCTNPPEALLTASKRLPGWLAVTRGACDLLCYNKGVLTEVPTYKVKAEDTTGAGDAWHGAFTFRLAQGEDELTAARFANAVAAMKCLKAGGRKGLPSLEETLNFMGTQDLGDPLSHRLKDVQRVA